MGNTGNQTGASTVVVETDPTKDPTAGSNGNGSTRERILDIALELFTDQGYDKTSLRQIAERLGFSKAAIYYHFDTKGEILMALHLRLHEVGIAALDSIGDAEWSPETWGTLLDLFIDQILEHRALVMLHDRNRAALEELHRGQHEAEHDDLDARLQRALSNPALPPRDRVRMASAFGAVLGTLVFTGNAFSDIPPDELGDMLREAVADILGRS
jgi:AcrR family transcriptional regulator